MLPFNIDKHIAFKVVDIVFVNGTCLQIVGEIRAARNALVQVTAKLRSYLYRDISPRDISSPKDMLPPSISAPSQPLNVSGTEPSSVKSSPSEVYQGNDPPSAVSQNIHTAPFNRQPKVMIRHVPHLISNWHQLILCFSL